MLFAGCSLNEKLEDFLEKEKLVAKITYHANGGYFDSSQTEKDIYYHENDMPLDIGNPALTDGDPSNGEIANGSAKIERNEYTIAGWYAAEVDADGNPVYLDEENGIVKLADPFDFTRPLAKGDEFHIYAAWSANVKVRVKLGGNRSIVHGGVTYQPGDEVDSLGFGTLGTLDKPRRESAAKLDGNTFLEYYADQECTQPVDWPIKKGDTDSEVYAKYIEGDWIVVDNASGFQSMLTEVANSADKGGYLVADIDFEGRSIGYNKSKLMGKIEGNGHTVKNFSVTRQSISGKDNSYGMFSTVESTASVRNLKFVNVDVTFTGRNGKFAAAYFAARFKTAAVIENVSFEDGTLYVGMAKGDGYDITNIEDEYGTPTSDRYFVADMTQTALGTRYPTLTFTNVLIKNVSQQKGA